MNNCIKINAIFRFIGGFVTHCLSLIKVIRVSEKHLFLKDILGCLDQTDAMLVTKIKLNKNNYINIQVPTKALNV